MNEKKSLSAGRWAVITGMLLLLCFPALSLEGARKGLLLWYNTVLPTLLPFMIFSGLLIGMEAVPVLITPFSPLLKRGLGLSDAGAFVLLTGMLCGYPMGAKNCSDLLDRKDLSLPEARTLLAVSNFPSPMFLAGYMMTQTVQAAAGVPVFLWQMAVSIYLPALPIFFLASWLYGFRRRKDPGKLQTADCRHSKTISGVLDEAMSSSAETMVKIGMYLMLFSILARFITLLPIPGDLLPVIFASAAEMTTGMDLASRTLSGLPALLVITGAGAFGGFSGVFQVNSVLKNAGLSIRHYVLWKTVHMLGACFVFTLLWGPR